MIPKNTNKGNKLPNKEKEIYFAKFDALIKLVYNPNLNQLYYTAHRKLEPDELKEIAAYILHIEAPLHNYYENTVKKGRQSFGYVGTSVYLKVTHTKFKKNSGIEITTAINELMTSSFSEYYSNKILEKILDIRSAKQITTNDKIDLKTLIVAYNSYVPDKDAILLESVLAGITIK